MAYGYRRYRRSHSNRRGTRKWTYKGRIRRTARSYRRRRRASTRSAVVKLSLDTTWLFRTGAQNNLPTYNCFRFTPAQIPGFRDYHAAYSKFRILKAELYIGRAMGGGYTTDGLNANYLLVGSRPFANTVAPLNSTGLFNGPSLVPSQYETALRQTKWQKVKYPSTTRTAIKAGFYPFTMVSTGGPANAPALNTRYAYQRVWEARKWMPMTWTGYTQDTPTGDPYDVPGSGIVFYGPYMVVDLNGVNTTDSSSSGEISAANSQTCNVQLVLKVQFSGQR